MLFLAGGTAPSTSLAAQGNEHGPPPRLELASLKIPGNTTPRDPPPEGDDGKATVSLWERPTLTGTWRGLRPQISTRGMEVEAVHTAEGWLNARGGAAQRGAHLHNFAVGLALDGEQLVGWGGTRASIAAIGNAGTSLAEHVGDAQGVSNIEAPPAWRLYEAWIEGSGFGEAASVRVGLYDLNSEFYVTETAALFINSSHGIGPEFSQTGQNGPSIFPFTAVGARLRVQPTGGWYLQGAVLDGVPGDPTRTDANVIRFDEADGWLFSGEVGHAIGSDDAAPSRKIALGGWTYTAPFEPIVPFDRHGDPLPPQITGTWGVYALAEGILVRDSDDPSQGWRAFGRVGMADARVYPVWISWGAGVVSTGFFDGRDEDQLGFAVATFHNGPPVLIAGEMAGEMIDGTEANFELTYRAQITPWLAAQPDIQYVVNPGTDSHRSDAFVFGQRFEIAF